MNKYRIEKTNNYYFLSKNIYTGKKVKFNKLVKDKKDSISIIQIEPLKSYNEIELNHRFFYLYIDYQDYLSIEVDRKLRNRIKSRYYCVEKSDEINILSIPKESLEILKKKKLLKWQNNESIYILGLNKPKAKALFVKIGSFSIFSRKKAINYKNFEIEINIEKKKVEELNRKLEKIEKYSNNNNNLIEIIELMKELKQKDNEIKEIKARYPFELLKGEEMLSVIFSTVSQQFNYSIICKNTDIFITIEEKLYKEYPDCANSENYFMVNGNIINRFKSLKDNNIHNSDIILLKIINESINIS